MREPMTLVEQQPEVASSPSRDSVAAKAPAHNGETPRPIDLPADASLALHRLEQVATDLHRATETLQAFIQQLESRLARSAPRVTAWLESPEDILGPDGETGWQLGYAKWRDEGSWRLMLRRVRRDETGSLCILGHHAPLATASRLVRLHALEKLGVLFRLLTRRAEGFVTDLNEKLVLCREDL
jgi:hypothetical protein